MNPVISRLVAWLAHRLLSRARELPPKEPAQPATKNGANRLLLFLLCATGLLTACKTDEPPPLPRMPDMAPVGDGMKTLAYALVGAAVVMTLGRMARH